MQDPVVLRAANRIRGTRWRKKRKLGLVYFAHEVHADDVQLVLSFIHRCFKRRGIVWKHTGPEDLPWRANGQWPPPGRPRGLTAESPPVGAPRRRFRLNDVLNEKHKHRYNMEDFE